MRAHFSQAFAFLCPRHGGPAGWTVRHDERFGLLGGHWTSASAKAEKTHDPTRPSPVPGHRPPFSFDSAALVSDHLPRSHDASEQPLCEEDGILRSGVHQESWRRRGERRLTPRTRCSTPLRSSWPLAAAQKAVAAAGLDSFVCLFVPQIAVQSTFCCLSIDERLPGGLGVSASFHLIWESFSTTPDPKMVAARAQLWQTKNDDAAWQPGCLVHCHPCLSAHTLDTLESHRPHNGTGSPSISTRSRIRDPALYLPSLPFGR